MYTLRKTSINDALPLESQQQQQQQTIGLLCSDRVHCRFHSVAWRGLGNDPYENCKFLPPRSHSSVYRNGPFWEIHWPIIAASQVCFRFRISCCNSKQRPHKRDFLIPCKIQGDRSNIWVNLPSLGQLGRNVWHTFGWAIRDLGDLALRKKKTDRTRTIYKAPRSLAA